LSERFCIKSAIDNSGLAGHPLGMAFPLIIGLGNPGRQYEETRHNVGFMVLDRLALAAGVAFASVPKWQSHMAKLPDGTLLLKPQTFMNLSGQAVAKVARFHKWEPTELLVIYDDVALSLGTLRFREQGSAGGHNGIKSLIQHFGTDAFPRLKLGIGGPRPGEMVGHVLGKFAPDEREGLENMLATALDAVHVARSQGVAIAANRFHQKPKPPPTREAPPTTPTEHPPPP
jgi:PTH1 family peptidyl-tRNA hydrolase